MDDLWRQSGLAGRAPTSVRVDYLNRDDSRRLVTGPVPLEYPPAVVERLYELTQGHPALLQLLCKTLVDIANRDGRTGMSQGDLGEAVGRAIDRETPAMERFWNEFCTAPACRTTVEDILAGRAPGNRPALARLAEHGYIVQREGHWRLRVPLFEEWLLTYRDGFGEPRSA